MITEVKVNVYDFDGTVYDGESTLDFYLYCVRRHPKAIKYIFVVLWSFIKYKLCLVSENELMFLAKRYILRLLVAVLPIMQVRDLRAIPMSLTSI